MSFWDNLFGTNDSDANKALRQAREDATAGQARQQQMFQPYINAGQNAMGTLQGQYGNNLVRANPLGHYTSMVNNANPMDQYNNMVNDPNALMYRIGSGFKESPGYQHIVDQMTRASNNAANAGGYTGSPQHQEYLANEIGGEASKDYNNYFNNAMGLYNTGLQGKNHMYDTGLQGIGSMYDTALQGFGNINQMGYQASGGAAGTLGDMLRQQAETSYRKSDLAYENANNQRNMIFGTAGAMTGSGMFGGGWGGGGGMAPVSQAKPAWVNPNYRGQ